MPDELYKCPSCGKPGFRICIIGPVIGMMGELTVRRNTTVCSECGYSETKEVSEDEKVGK